MKTEPVNTVASGHVMSCCLATGLQRVLLRDVSVFTTALPWKRAWCSATRLDTVFNLPRLETARSKHRFPLLLRSVFTDFCVSTTAAWRKHVTIYTYVTKYKFRESHVLSSV
jgi:hypothetical protein